MIPGVLCATAHIRIVLSNGKSYTVSVAAGKSKTSSTIPYGHPVSEVLMNYDDDNTYNGKGDRTTLEWGGLFVS